MCYYKTACRQTQGGETIVHTKQGTFGRTVFPELYLNHATLFESPGFLALEEKAISFQAVDNKTWKSKSWGESISEEVTAGLDTLLDHQRHISK